MWSYIREKDPFTLFGAELHKLRGRTMQYGCHKSLKEVRPRADNTLFIKYPCDIGSQDI